MHNGALYYVKDGNKDRYYTWCYKNPTTGKIYPEGVTIPNTATTDNPTFQDNDKWYVLTTVSLDGLGAVSGNATLTLKGNTTVGGSVFGGGAESEVAGNTIVNLQGKTQVTGNVFGGGDQGVVEGSTTVNIEE